MSKTRINSAICLEKGCWCTLCVSDCMEIIDKKLCVGKEFWFSCHAIRTQGACKVVYDSFWSFLPSGNKGREHIIPTFTSWNAVESIANTMRAPDTHNTASQATLSILGIEFGALGTPLARRVEAGIVFEFWIVRSITNLRHPITAACLICVSAQKKLKIISRTYLSPRLFCPLCPW